MDSNAEVATLRRPPTREEIALKNKVTILLNEISAFIEKNSKYTTDANNLIPDLEAILLKIKEFDPNELDAMHHTYTSREILFSALQHKLHFFNMTPSERLLHAPHTWGNNDGGFLRALNAYKRAQEQEQEQQLQLQQLQQGGTLIKLIKLYIKRRMV